MEFENFLLLRSPPEGLPPSVTSVLKRRVFDIQWRLAQRVPLSFRIKLWLVPGKDMLCIVNLEADRSVNQACTSSEEAIESGVSLTVIDGHHRLIVGLAPDGTRGVSVLTDGELSTARVIRGVFAIQDSSVNPPDSVSLLGYGSPRN